MTVETAVKIEGEKCGMDVVSSSCEDRPPSSVGGGDGNVDGKDDYVFVNGSDAGSDDHGDVEGKRELNVSASNGEFEGNLEGVGVNVNGGDQFHACDNGYNGKLDNVGKVDGDESKFESGGIVDEESDGKVEGGELVKKNGEIKLESEDVVVDRESAGENGDADNVVGGDDVAVRDMEVAKETDVDDKVEDVDSGVEKGDETNASVDGIGNLSVDDDDKERDLSGVDSGSGVMLNGSSAVEVEPQVSHGESGDQLHLGRSEEDENQAKEPEKSGDGVITSELVEDNVNPHIDEVEVTDSEPSDDTIKQLKPIDVEVKREIQEDGAFENQPPDGYIKAPDREVEELLLDESITEKQQDLQLGDSMEPGPVEAESEVRELGDYGALELSGSQDLNTLDSEAAASELQQSGEIEDKDQYASELTTESVECQEPQTVLESKGAVNQSNVELMASEVDISALNSTDHSDEAATDQTEEVNGNPETSTVDLQSDNSDNPVIDHELDRVHGEQKAESSAQLGGCLDSSVQDVSLQDQVAEETEAVDVIGKEASSEDHTEATDLSVVNSSNETTVDEEDQDLDASHVGDTGAANEVHVPEFSHDSGSCLRSGDGDLTVAVGNEMDSSVTCDSDLRDGTVVEEGSLAGDNGIRSSADDVCSKSKQENSSNALPSANGTESEVKTAIGEIDVAPLNPKISFGSFNPNLQSDRNNVHPNVMNRSINFSTNQSDFVGNSKSITDTADVVASLKSEANNVHSTDLNHDKNGAGVVSLEQTGTEEVSASPVEESGINSVSGLDVNPDLVRRPFYYLIRIPKFDDVKLSEEIKKSEEEVKEKTLNRDVVRTKWQNYKASLSDSKSHLEAARSEERAAHKLLMAKKREIDSAQSLLNLARNAITVEDVDSRIRNMEHKMEHETLILAEEKRMLGEIKKMKQQREQLAANTRSQQELQQALDRRVETEDHLKILRKEMDALRSNHAKANESFKALKKKSDEESALLRDLHNQFCSADTIRQKAYVQLQTLKKQAYEKNKLFYYYKDAAKVAYDLAGAGKKDSLEQHCLNQVEKIMELWNNNDEFRKEYIRCNERSTSRRFKTKDGRALGPDEPPSLDNVSNIRQKVVAKVNSVGTVPSLGRDFPLVTKNAQEESSKKVTEQKSRTALGKKRFETTSKDSVAESSGRIDIEEKVEKEHKPTKEEEELIRKEEQKRREEEEKQRTEEEKRRKEEEVRLKEQHRLEEIAKAKEAQLRKKRLAEKAQARAEARARKEAEEKLKEKEKRAKKKEKKKGIISEITETEPAQLPESSSETIREPELTEKPVAVTKKSHKPALYTKQVKMTKSISAPPAPLRNRGKRRIPQWVWWLVPMILTVIFIFPLGKKDIVGFFKRFTSGSSY